MCSIRGTKQEVKPGLYSITRDADDGGKLLAFYNETEDTQFNVCYILTDANVKALGTTQVAEGGKYAFSIYPGETKEFIQGTWRGFKRSLSYGAPDKEWQEKQTAAKSKALDDSIQALKDFVKQHPRADGKYTAEYIAELCIQYNQPFIDLTFPPRSSSLARDWEPAIGEFDWLKPEQYLSADKPKSIFVGEIEPNDIDQGILGDCYLLASFACVAEFPLLVKDAYSLQQFPELGLYRILVCKNGWWQVVIVDDYLPCKNGHPCFARNKTEPNELWVSLLEKAYAKLHGSYSAIKAGDAALAIADILGAPYKKINQMPEWEDKPKLFKVLKQADEDDHLMALGTPGRDLQGTERESLQKKYEEFGLAIDHAYSLLRVKEPKGHQLCMLRNPWGSGDSEWTGAWSDHSPLWTKDIQEEVGFVAADDGTFWMGWEDVIKYFDQGSVSMVMREWPQIRVTGNFIDGMSDIMLVITVSAPVNCYFGWHQRDNRGLPSGDKDRKYIGILLTVLREKGETLSEKICETSNGAYATNRDGYIATKLEASPNPYLILVQPYNAEISKSFTVSFFVETPSSIKSIDFVSHQVEKPTKYLPPTKCTIKDWQKKAAANYQVRMADTGKAGMIMTTMQGEGVDMQVFQGRAAPPAPKPAIVAPKPNTPLPSAAKHVDPQNNKPPATVPASVPSSPPPPGKAIQGGIKLQLIILAGRNLVAKDSNGLSDPYVTVKLKTPTGTKLSQDQRIETRYIKETLNPVWAEVFRFNLRGDEILCIKCWDKDLFGHDLMGTLNLPASYISSKLSAGGPAIIEWFPLIAPPDDVSGDLQLAMSWVL